MTGRTWLILARPRLDCEFVPFVPCRAAFVRVLRGAGGREIEYLCGWRCSSSAILDLLAYRQGSALPANDRVSGFDEFDFIFIAFGSKPQLKAGVVGLVVRWVADGDVRVE